MTRQSAHSYRPLALVALLFTALVIAWVIGAINNLAGAMVSADYYSMVLRWDFTEGRLRAIIAQGLFEATFAGLAAGLLYALIVAWVSRASCPYRPAARHFVRWSLLVVPSWLLGGTFALALRFLSPHQLAHVLIPDVSGLNPHEFTRFVWVGGTIMGCYVGGVVAVLLACITFPARWRQIRLRLRMARIGHTAFCIACGYNQRRTTGNVCPECGARIRTQMSSATV